MSKKLPVQYEGEFCYNIHIENSFSGFHSALDEISDLKSQKVCIVTDSNVAKIYLDDIKKICENKFEIVESYIFDAGESSKNMDTVQKLYQKLINSHFERKDLLIALGGGVVGDLTGFTAATYLRGISFIQVPTTLLSQVDSSIGGKTGVDFLQYKNMVGAFYMPRMVYINTKVLHSLPQVQFQSGMGEVIKHGLIKDKAYFQWLKENRNAICSLEDKAMEHLIFESCNIKKMVVEEDPKEQGIRAHLNFGHTLGHAIEKMSDFSLYHGQCVSVGMNGAAFLSMKNHGLSQDEYEDIFSTLTSYGLPVTVKNYSKPELLSTTKSDKKMEAGHIKFVVLDSLGNAVIDNTYTDEDLLQAIDVIVE